MKTPEEIKKGLECCSSGRTVCTVECPYHADGTCNSDAYKLEKDAIAYIQRLEADKAELKRELGAAVSDLKTISNITYDACLACVFSPGEGRNCTRCEEINCFAWRGVCEENSGTKE